MENNPIRAFLAILTAVSLCQGCDLFDGKGDCGSAACPGNDLIDIVYRSAADSTTGLFGPGQFELEQLTLTPLLRDKNGRVPFILKAKIGPSAEPTVQVTADENLRGIALQLANFAPDTILMTTGLRPADPCCTETVTVSQLLANGNLVPSIGSVITVGFFK